MKVFLGRPKACCHRYRAALARCGMEAVSLGPWEACDGLLLPGGGDIAPGLYGCVQRGAEAPDEALDRRELALVGEFVRRGRPVLGICRGLQVINVYFGGTLDQDIPGHRQVGGVDACHAVKGGRGRLLDWEGDTVNSAHHQRAARLGEGLRAVQWAPDGTVEALEHESLPILAVQWHPERWGSSGEAVFRAFSALLGP